MNEVSPEQSEKEEKQEILLSWTSPSRLFKKRDPEYFKTIGAIVFLLTVILIFASEFVLVAAVLSIVFLIYVLSTVPPEDVTHTITNLGLESAGHFYRWNTLFEFWFEEQWQQTMLVVRPIVGTRIIILLSGQHTDVIRKLLTKHIPYRETPEKSWVDNAATWLSEKIPLDRQPQP